jgi:DNA-nicking Smr family endonuclease
MKTARAKGAQMTGSRRYRGSSPAETALWRRAVADVEPLVDGGEKSSVVPPPATELPSVQPSDKALPDRPPRPVALTMSRPEPAPSDLIHGAASGIDKRTLARLRRGLIAPQARLDLHNLRQDEAHRLLTGVLAASQAAGRRCVLVITGKGYGADGAVGVLKTMVPRWLVEPPNRGRVLAFCHATRGHGGEGALYVLLRRSRAEPGG